MPRIWVGNEWQDPEEGGGGLSYDYCDGCYSLALSRWEDDASVAYHTGELDRSIVLEEVVVDNDDHPDYNDCWYNCLSCGKPLTEEDDG